MIVFIFILIVIPSSIASFGYDSGGGTACPTGGGNYRGGRQQNPIQPAAACDLARQTWCTVAGSAYPWHAVRRFIRENQGLMRRMYGEERHIAVLRAELVGNDIEQVQYRYSNPENEVYRSDFKRRYSKDNDRARLLNQDDAILNTKFIYSEEPNIRTNELYTMPHFRQATSTTTEMTSTTSSSPIENNSIVENTNNKTYETNSVYMNFTISFSRENLNQSSVEETTHVENTTESDEVTESMSTTEEGTTYDSTTPTMTSTKASTSASSTSTQPPAAEQLFQDADEKAANVNYKMRGINACPVKEEVVAPFWANNTRGEILALLNLYPFEQYVHWEKCTFEHRQMYCRDGCRCEQQYRLHRLLAYDPNNECRGIFSDWFKFPSCCVCKCYNMPMEFRVTSRSPRNKENSVPEWYRKKINKIPGT